MAKLDNSERRLPQATYAQVQLREGNSTFRPRRPLLKTALVMAGKPSRAETDSIRTQISQEISAGGANTAALQAQLRAAEAISGIIDSSSSPDLERIAPVMANIDSQALVSLSERLIRIREERI